MPRFAKRILKRDILTNNKSIIKHRRMVRWSQRCRSSYLRLKGNLCKYAQDVNTHPLAEGLRVTLQTMKSTTGWNARTAAIKKINFTNMETNQTQIEQNTDAPLPALPVKFDPQKDVENAQKAAQALMKIVDASKPLTMNGKRYLYFEHWQTIGQFFNHSVGIEWTKELIENDKFYGYEAKAVIYNQQGVIVGGAEAMCTVDESNWSNKPKFQLKSMAQTRAMAKALRSRFGFIAVLAGVEATPAEEMMGESYPSITPPSKTPQNGSQQVTQGAGKPSDKQLKLIRDLMEQKGYSVADIIDQGFSPLEQLTGGKGGTASELIDFLLQAKSKGAPVADDRVPFDDEGISDDIPL